MQQAATAGPRRALKLPAGRTRTGRCSVPARVVLPARLLAVFDLAQSLRRALVAGLALVLLAGASIGQAWEAERLLQVAQRAGPRALAGARALQALIAASSELEEAARLAAVNQFFNRRIVFTDDEQVWGQTDYWASPVELLDKGRGDCEDFAIAKYFSLIAGGVPAARLRLVYVRAQVGGPGGVQIAHMVLAYAAQPAAEPLILDNLIEEIRPASRRPDLTPVFSFNGEGLWQGTSGPSAGDPTARLSRWRDVLAKARAEGFP